MNQQESTSLAVAIGTTPNNPNSYIWTEISNIKQGVHINVAPPEKGMSISQVARDLGVNANSLQNWKKAYQEDQQHSFPGNGKMKPEKEELRKLRKELNTVKMERDILKKL